MSQFLSKPAQIQQEIEDILSWADQLEVAVSRLHPDLEQRLRALPRPLKTLIVGEEAPSLFELCTAARVSRPGAVWTFDLLLGRKQDQVRAVLGNWCAGQVQQVTCFQGTETVSEREQLEEVLEAHRADSRLIAGSSISGPSPALASPLDTLGIEKLSLLESDEGFKQARQRLQTELQRASLKHKSCLCAGSRLQIWLARGQALYWGISSGDNVPWVLHLSSQPPEKEEWAPCGSLPLEPKSNSGFQFASDGGRTFLACLNRPESVCQLKGLALTPLHGPDPCSHGQAAIIAELGQPDLVRRLAALALSWEQLEPARPASSVPTAVLGAPAPAVPADRVLEAAPESPPEKAIDWETAVQWLESLPAAEREYWGPTLDRLRPLECLDPEHVQSRLRELKERVGQPVARAKSPGEVSRRVIETALEQLRKVLRGAEFDRLQLGDMQKAANRAAIWRKLASLNQDALPALPTWDLRSEAGSWTDLGEADWHRLQLIQAALACLQVRNPEISKTLRLAFAKTLERKGKTLKKDLESMETRCQRELDPLEVAELRKRFSAVTGDAPSA